ncbi:MAG: hypothetical protein R6W77_02065 [Trueperaceae bacterium]
MRADVLEQVFLRSRAGRTTLLLVLEAPSGARTRVTLQTPAGDEADAMRFLARYLEREGLAPSARLRVRRERGGALEDAPALREALLRATSRSANGP